MGQNHFIRRITTVGGRVTHLILLEMMMSKVIITTTRRNLPLDLTTTSKTHLNLISEPMQVQSTAATTLITDHSCGHMLIFHISLSIIYSGLHASRYNIL
jgi:hypothetical protein